jgi:hypothetical protein
MTHNQTVTPELPNESSQAEGRENAIRLAAEWLSKNRAECPQPIIPTLRNRFGLSAKEAINAITLSYRINCGAAAQ